ncbi:MAG: DUF2804 family protein [Eubacteriales bacterium]|nr:DUF2804 family protein [Eubacteriales bacterium]
MQERISELRQPTSPPESLVDKDGQAVFGTFDKEIKNLNLIDCYRPYGKRMTRPIQDFKLTEWEATEVVTDECAIVSAIYSMGKVGFGIVVAFDRKTHDIDFWLKPATSRTLQVAPNLINSTSFIKTKALSIEVKNDMDKGKASTSCSLSNKKGTMAYNVNLTRLSPPSVVSIPFGDNMPLYTQKDFFSAQGYIEKNGERVSFDDAVAVIDDHKGYYPRRAHYDWLTTMGKINHDGQETYIALNLTLNQSINQHDYNENLVWLKDRQIILPPVTFEKHQQVWRVYDQFDRVNIAFEIQNTYVMTPNVGVAKVEYYLPFGVVSGYVRDDDDTAYDLSGLIGIAEDKTTLL